MGNREHAVQMFNAAVTAANDRSQQGHLDRAYKLFVSACCVDPTFGLAFSQMASNNADLSQNPAHDFRFSNSAVAGWRRALECEQTPDERSRVLTNIGWYCYLTGQIDDAFGYLLESIDLNPNNAAAWCNLSVIHGILDHAQDSIICAKYALKLDPHNIQHEIALAFAHMHAHQFDIGLKYFEKRFPWRLHEYMHSPYPQWKGESGGTLYLMSDQGLGDTLSFSRFVERAAKRCVFIHASVHPELMRLFSHAFMHIKNINLIPQPQPFPQADYWSTFMSLPVALGLNNGEIINAPHISCPRMDFTNDWKLPDRKLHIGIAWKGNARSDIDKHRSIPLEHFLELYRVPGIQLYGLQCDQQSNEIYQIGATALIRDLKPYVNDVADTTAILQHLDMVICLESALGHIAGLAGKETWIPYSYLGRDYRAGLRGENPIWYPKHRFFRQEKGETWQPVFMRINEALEEKINAEGK